MGGILELVEMIIGMAIMVLLFVIMGIWFVAITAVIAILGAIVLVTDFFKN